MGRPSAVVLLTLGLLAGLAQALSLASPWSGAPLWWLQLLALAGLVSLVARSHSWRQAALLGFFRSILEIGIQDDVRQGTCRLRGRLRCLLRRALRCRGAGHGLHGRNARRRTERHVRRACGKRATAA